MYAEFKSMWRLAKASMMVLCEQVESGAKVLSTEELAELRAEVDRLVLLSGVNVTDAHQLRIQSDRQSLAHKGEAENIEFDGLQSSEDESEQTTESTEYTTATEGYETVGAVHVAPSTSTLEAKPTTSKVCGSEAGPSEMSTPVALPPPRATAFTAEEQEVFNEAFLRCMQGYEDIDVCGRRLARQFQRKCITLRHQLTPKLRALQMTRKQWKEAAVICPQLKRYPPGITISRAANAVQQATTGSHHSQSSQGVPDHKRRQEGPGYPQSRAQQPARADPANSNGGGGGGAALQDDRVPASAPGATGIGSSTTSEQRRGGGGDSVNSGSSDGQSIDQGHTVVDPTLLQNPSNQGTLQCGASPAAVTAQIRGSTSSTHPSSSAQPRLSPPPMMRVLTPAELRAWLLAPDAVVLPASAAPEQKVTSSRSEDPRLVGKRAAPAGEGGTTGTLSVGTNEARGATSHSAGKRRAEETQETDSVQHDTQRNKKRA